MPKNNKMNKNSIFTMFSTTLITFKYFRNYQLHGNKYFYQCQCGH